MAGIDVTQKGVLGGRAWPGSGQIDEFLLYDGGRLRKARRGRKERSAA